MKIMKQIISCIIFLALGISAVFNLLFLLDKISEVLLYSGFIILITVVFIISLMGIIIKNIRKQDKVEINIITPFKELGILYVLMLIFWVITYFITIIFK